MVATALATWAAGIATMGRFGANDCIGDYVEDGELDALQREVEGKVREVLRALVIDTEILERRFGSWRMGSVDLKRVNLSTILRFSERPVIAPFSMSGEAALALLQELAETAAIVSHDER